MANQSLLSQDPRFISTKDFRNTQASSAVTCPTNISYEQFDTQSIITSLNELSASKPGKAQILYEFASRIASCLAAQTNVLQFAGLISQTVIALRSGTFKASGKDIKAPLCSHSKKDIYTLEQNIPGLVSAVCPPDIAAQVNSLLNNYNRAIATESAKIPIRMVLPGQRRPSKTLEGYAVENPRYFLGIAQRRQAGKSGL